MRIIQEFDELSAIFRKASSTERNLFNQCKISNSSSLISVSSLKLKMKEKFRSIVTIFFKFFKRFNSFTSNEFILNIFCLKNFFCWLNCFNLTCFVQIVSMIKQFCLKIVFQAASIFSSARFNFVMIGSIELKSIIRTEDSHFLSRLTHFEHFLNNINKRYCFYLTAQRTQKSIATAQ